MSAPTPQDRPARHWLIGILLAYTLLGGVLCFLGWALDLPRLADWGWAGITIQPNSTVCVVLASAALLLRPRFGTASSVCGGIVLLIGGLSLFEWLTGRATGIDSLLLFHREWGRTGTVVPGRIGPPASTAFTLLGLALILTPSRSVRRYAVPIGLATLILSLVSITAYLYGAASLYSLPRSTVISLQTASFIAALSFALIASIPERQPTRLLLEDSGAGILARRALPVVLLLPLVLGWLRLAGQNAGLFDTSFGTTLRSVIEVVLLGGLLWWAITALRTYERALRVSRRAVADSERRFREMIDALPQAVYTTDAEGYLKHYNPAAVALAGREPQLGKDRWRVCRKLFYADGAPIPENDSPLVLTMREGRPVRGIESIAEREDGTRSWIEPYAAPLRDASGAVVGGINMLLDITERKHAEVALRETDRRKDEFLATLAHELRNPLAPIRNALEIMRRAPSDIGLIEAARRTAERQMSHLVRLVDDLMDVSRVSRDKLELLREPLDLRDVIRHALEAEVQNFEAARHTLHVDLPPAPVTVFGDPVRLSQVVGNLLANACRYTTSGGRVSLALRATTTQAVITIEDNGVGIPTEQLHAIFDMFSQVDRSLERTRGGLGIGLHLVQRLLALHGGSVIAHSEGEGRGSRFVVTLPLLTLDTGQFRALPESAAADPQQRPRRVLVVDDNIDSARSLATLLQLVGNDTAIANDGMEAIQKALSYRPDVVLLDIGMPRMNGYDVCRALRKELWSKDVKILALTGWGEDEVRRKTLDAGFNGHLVKPIDTDALIKALEET